MPRFAQRHWRARRYDHDHKAWSASRQCRAGAPVCMEVSRGCLGRIGVDPRRTPGSRYIRSLGSGSPAQGSTDLSPRFLLDTHIVVRWLSAPRKLSREQTRVLRDAIGRREPLAISAITLLEMAVLFGDARIRSRIPLDEILDRIDSNPAFQIIPFAVDCSGSGGSWRSPSRSRRSGHRLHRAYAGAQAHHVGSAHHRLGSCAGCHLISLA